MKLVLFFKSNGCGENILPTASGLLFLFAIASMAFGVLCGCSQNQDTHAPKSIKNIRSVYTPLTEEKCKLIDSSDEGGYSLQECPGILGYQLQVEDFDVRMSVSVVDPSGNVHNLDYCQYVTSHFSELGQSAEWRTATVDGKEVPIAIIVRVYSHDPENDSKLTPYLVVAKITPDEICVTNRIQPDPKQNEEARKAADRAISSECLDAVSD